jgi:circadian clock protein KaiB
MDTAAEPIMGARDEESRDTRLVLRLYVAGSAPNSTRAHANLLALLQRAGTQDYDLEIIDCIRDPRRALQDGVLVTPTLLKLEPQPVETLIGTLSDARKVALTLGLVGDPEADAESP